MDAVTDKSKAQMKKEPEKSKEEPSSMFQRQRVDMLLGELMRKFPLPIIPNPNAPTVSAATEQASRPDNKDANTTNTAAATSQTANTVSSNVNGNNNSNVDFKPPEKRAK